MPLGRGHGTPAAFDRRAARPAETPWPTGSSLIVCRQNQCTDVDPQAETRPAAPCRCCELLPAGLDCSRLDSPRSSPLPESSSQSNETVDVTHRRERQVPREPEWRGAWARFPPSQHPEEVDAETTGGWTLASGTAKVASFGGLLRTGSAVTSRPSY